MNTLKYILTALIIHLTVNIFAQQTTWEYVLRTPEIDEEIFTMIEGIDGSVYVGGRSLLLGREYPYKSLVFKLDNQGGFIDSILFALPDKWTSVNQIIHTSSNNYALLSGFNDPDAPYSNGGLLMHNMNYDLELSNQTLFWADTNHRIIGGTASIESNGNLFINFAVTVPVSFIKSYFIETDSNFNIIKQKFLTDFPKAYSHLKKIDDNIYWALNLYTNKYEIFDSAFNIVGEQRVPERITGNFGVKWESDTSFYLMGDHDLDDENHIGLLHQPHYFDTTGYLFNSWGRSDTVDFPAFTNGIDFRNKDSIFIGGTHNMPYFVVDPGQQPVPTWFVILQTDSLLNVRWERFYGGNANYLMMNLIATRDGGCLVAGTRYDYMNDPVPQTDIIVLKLNSEGLLVGDHELPETQMHEAIVYPNPGTDALQIRLAVQHPTALLELYDANGRLVLSQQLHQKENRIAVDHLPSGTYIYRLSADTGLMEKGKWVKM
ncbi:MAG: T9SS type A sorting domain-containing protein [Bacteroidales bacterium]|nr:T9SS type A sorting domain-containing protein [Bacteroidales bacterium]